MKSILGHLQSAYQHPVEIEFALNVRPAEPLRINLLQCRPMQVRSVDQRVKAEPPAYVPSLISAHGAVIGPSRVIRPDRIIYVAPERYAALNMADRASGGARHRQDQPRPALDVPCCCSGPSRWGTRDALARQFSRVLRHQQHMAICEIVAMHDSLVPDVSLGTHFINELIEADMLYFALFPGREGNNIDERLIRRQANRLSRIAPDHATGLESFASPT